MLVPAEMIVRTTDTVVDETWSVARTDALRTDRDVSEMRRNLGKRFFVVLIVCLRYTVGGSDRGPPPPMARGGWGGPRGGMDRMPPSGGFRDRRGWRDRYLIFVFSLALL